jgi:hypothetical protein
MRTTFGIISFTIFVLVAYNPPALAQSNPGATDEIALLRQEIERMRSDYEARIEQLERRLDAAEEAEVRAENQAAQGPPVADPPAEYAAVPAAPPAAPTTTSSGRDNS